MDTGLKGLDTEDLYTVAQINYFLDKTKGKSIEVSDFFPRSGKVYLICNMGKEKLQY